MKKYTLPLHLLCKRQCLGKFFNIMRLSTLGLFACAFATYAANMDAQTAKVNITNSRMTIGAFIEQVEQETGYMFVYNKREVDANRMVLLKAGSSSVADCLNRVFDGSGITYVFDDDYIVLTKRGDKQVLSIAQQVGKNITGVIVDETGLPIIGANIVEKGTTNGTVTDMDGKFSINVSSDNAILVVSYIGYVDQQFTVKNQKKWDIVLKEDLQSLDEVVVVGYGTQRKGNIATAVTTVKAETLQNRPVQTVGEALQGQVPGLMVTGKGAPGEAPSLQLRGSAVLNADNSTAPLVLVDGVPADFNFLNPEDIESINVLKDAASAAIYGSRAANGVLLITTKRGKEGKPKVTYSGSATVQTMATKYEMLDAQDFMIQSNRWFKEKWMYDNKVGIYGGKNESEAGSAYHPKYSDADIANPVNDTDWYDRITRTGFQTQHNISINGGTEYTKYLISGNFFNQKGIVKNNGMSRYTGRVNLDQKLSKYAKVGINLTVSRNTLDNVPLGAGQNEYASILVSAAQFSPLLSVKDENGDYSLNQQAAYIPNPVSLLEISDQTTKERFLATPFVEIKPINELTLKASFGIDRNYQRREVYMPKTTLYGEKADGRADIGQYDRSDYLLELTANYAKRLGDHNLNALVGYSFQRFTSKYLNAGNQGFLTDAFLFNNLGAGTYEKPWVGSSASKSEMASFFGRVNYTYKDRYLVTATLRADGASNFAKNNRWGYFPSVALGWRFTEENFARSLNLDKVLSNGKLRLSYGQTGNSNIGDKSVTYYGTGYNKVFGNKEYTGVYVSQIGNPDLKWETTTEWNVGLDLGFLNNRFNVTAEYFHKVVSDLLSSRSVLSYNEVGSIAANIGKTQSQGFELTINTKNFDTKDFSWNTDFTFSFYRDKWKERDENWSPNPYDMYNAPLRGYYMYLSDGLIQPGEEVSWMPGALPGQVKLKDIDGYAYNEDGTYKTDKHGIPLRTGKPDGKIDYADAVFKGCSDPGYLLGLNNTFRYKNFDLNVYFYGQLDLLKSGSYKDYWIVGSGTMTGVNNLYRGYNMPTSAKEVWSHDNTSGKMPGYFQYMSNYGYGDYFLEKSWFIRCRNITLGYTLPVKSAKKLVSNVRIYADVNNLFTITPYDGLDVETDDSYWAYPNVRSFSIGLDITF